MGRSQCASLIRRSAYSARFLAICILAVSANRASAVVSDGFDFPVGPGPDWYVALGFGEQYFGPNSYNGQYDLGEDWNLYNYPGFPHSPTNPSADCGQPVYATSNGTVVFSRWGNNPTGNAILIRHDLPDGTQVESAYMHLQMMAVSSGQTVTRGQQIGTVGSTIGSGYTTTCHLHFEIRRPESPEYGQARVTTYPKNSSNTKDWTSWEHPTSYINSHRPPLASPLAKPTLTAPITGMAIATYPSTNFTWTSTGAAQYEIQFDDNVGFGTPVAATVATNSYALPGPLSPLGTYYWRVRGVNGAQKGPWSTESWTVKIGSQLVGPKLTLPLNGSSSTSSSVLLQWGSEVTASQGYHVQVSANSAFTDIEAQAFSLSSTTYQFTASGLANGVHFWRVFSQSALGVDAGVSVVWTFTVSDPAAPPAPTLSSPADGFISASCEVNLVWNPAAGASQYQVQVSLASDFSAAPLSSITALTYLPYSTAGTFYWRVRALNGGSGSAWSAPVRRFTLNASSAPVAPTLIAPTGSVSGPVIPFSWTSTASGYDLQVSSAPASTPYLIDQPINGTTFSTSLGPGSYVCRLRSRQSAQIGCWGAWQPFTVTTPPVPDPPTLGSVVPQGGGAVLFTWTAPPSVPAAAASYDIEAFQTDAGDLKQVSRTRLTGTSHSTAPTPLPVGEYKWHVLSRNNLDMPGAWSSFASFSKKSPTDIVNGPSAPFTPYAADPVNTATGNYTFHRTDLLVPAIGFPFEFSRTFNSTAVVDPVGALGAKWTHSFSARIEAYGATGYHIVMGDGRGLYFTWDAGSSMYKQLYAPCSGDLKPIPGVPGAFRYTTKSLLSHDFDASGRLTRLADRNGNALTLAYDGNGYLVSATDTSGRVYTFTHDAFGRIVSIADPIGRTVLYQYGATGDLIQVTNPRGKATLYEYDASHNLLKVTDARGNFLVRNTYYDAQGRVKVQQNGRDFVYNFAYDDANGITTVTDPPPGSKTTVYRYDNGLRLVSQTDRRGYTTRFTYDADNNRVAVTDPLGRSTRMTFDACGNMLTLTNALDQKTTMSYTATNQIAAIRDPLGRVTTFNYDPKFNLVGVSAPMGSTTTMDRDPRGLVTQSRNPNGAVTQFSYDPQGNLTQVVDALLRVTDNEYDGVGRLKKITEPGDTVPQRAVTQFVYDENDNLTQVIDALGKSALFNFDVNDNLTSSTTRRGNVWKTVYNENDMPVTKIDPANNTVQYVYDELDRVAQMTDQRGKVWSYSYDEEGHLLTATDPTASVVTRTYDPIGNLATVANANGHVTAFQYDPLNRLVTKVDPLYHAASLQYDAAGRIIKMTDAMNRDTLLEYDDLDRMTKVTDPMGGTAQYGYDAVGNRISVRDPLGNFTLFSYDQINRMLTMTDPLGRKTTYGYDTPGDRQTRLDARGILTTYVHDSNHRLTSIDYADATPDVTFISYDDDGNRIGYTISGLGSASYGYDALGRMTSATDLFGRALGYQYDPASNRTQIAYPGPQNVDYAYDDAGRLKTVTDWASAAMTYTYDPAGNLIEADYPNGAKETRTYDPAERLSQILHKDASAATLASLDYFHDEVGNIIRIDRQDPAQRHFKSENTSYGYDLANQLLNVAGQNQAFDANGNQTLIQRPDGTQIAMAFDAENRVKTLTVTPSGGPAGTPIAFDYDAAGLRIRSTQGATIERDLWDVNAGLPMPVYEDDGAAAQAQNLYGLALYARRAAGSFLNLHADQVGTVLAVTGGTGALAAGAAYDEFGEQTGAAGGAATQAFGFWGAYGVTTDEPTLLYARARRLDLVTSRFSGEDPERRWSPDTQRGHPYVNSLNDPLGVIDPTGKVIEVQWRPVYIDGINSHTYHTLIVIKPEHAGRYLADDRFRFDSVFIPLILYAALQAWGSQDGHLVVNTNNNLEGDVGSVRLAIPNGETEDKVIERLFALQSHYNGSLDYNPLPRLGGYNSNSYVAGLLEAAGLQPPDIPVLAPGWNEPIPASSFDSDRGTQYPPPPSGEHSK